MAFYFFSPGEFTGGPLGIHQAVAQINEIGASASIIYYDWSWPSNRIKTSPYGSRRIKVKNWRYRRNMDQRLADITANSSFIALTDDHFVVPESKPEIAQRLYLLGCKNVYLWWLSVDNFPLTNLKRLDIRQLIRRCHNLCQSYYAFDWVKSLGADKVSMLSDFVDLELDGSVIATDARQYDIAYLPSKSQGAEKIVSFLEQKYRLVALGGMMRDAVMETLSNTKIFLDFGHHPGKDRVPREAALCGCIPMIRREGAAKFEEDLPIPERLLVETPVFFDHAELANAVDRVLTDAVVMNRSLDKYRSIILNEKDKFRSELRYLISLDGA